MSQESQSPETAPEDLNAVMQARREKLQRLREANVDPYPHSFTRKQLAADILSDFDAYEGKEVAVAGRLMSLRKMGKASFAHLEDSSGRIQLYIRRDTVGEQNYEIFKLVDIGDIVGVTGSVLKTRTGEITIEVSEFRILSKTLRPLPVVKEKVEGDKRLVFDAFADKSNAIASAMSI